MTYNNPRNLAVRAAFSFNPTGGAPTGSKVYAVAPCYGTITEVGFMPNSMVASAMTLAVSLGNQANSAASAFTQIVTSTAASFSSTNLFEGAVASVSGFSPIAPAFVCPGDAIAFTTSGGNTSAIGVTCYAIIRSGY